MEDLSVDAVAGETATLTTLTSGINEVEVALEAESTMTGALGGSSQIEVDFPGPVYGPYTIRGVVLAPGDPIPADMPVGSLVFRTS